MELAVYKISGEKTTRKVKLNDTIFGIKPHDNVIYLDARHYMASQMQGTHSAKERGDITGSTRKVKRQKGTGTARTGSIKSPLLRGGGRTFGPRPRDHSFKLNKKIKRLARKSALSYKAQEKHITILEDFTFDEPKTKKYIDLLNAFKLTEKKTLLVLPKSDQNIIISSRNLKKAKVTEASSLNTYDILNASDLLIAESSMKEIEKILAQ